MRPALVLAMVAMLCSGLARAHDAADPTGAHDDEPWPETRIVADRYSVKLAGLLSVFDTEVAAGRGLGVSVDLENTLDYDEDVSTIGIEGFFRFGESGKHALQFNYVSFDRAASGILDEELPQFDLTFFGPYESEFDIELLSVTYRRSLVKTARAESGVSLGLSFYDFFLHLEGEILIDDGMGGTISGNASEGTDIVAPVPTVGFFLVYGITPNLIMDLSLDVIDLDIDVHDGRVSSTNASFAWFFSRNVGLGVGFNATDIVYENEKTNGDRLRVDYRQSAAVVFLDLVFGARPGSKP